MAVTRMVIIPGVEPGTSMAGAMVNFALVVIAPTGIEIETIIGAEVLLSTLALTEVVSFESALTRSVTGVAIEANGGSGAGAGGAAGVTAELAAEAAEVPALLVAVTVKE